MQSGRQTVAGVGPRFMQLVTNSLYPRWRCQYEYQSLSLAPSSKRECKVKHRSKSLERFRDPSCCSACDSKRDHPVKLTCRVRVTRSLRWVWRTCMRQMTMVCALNSIYRMLVVHFAFKSATTRPSSSQQRPSCQSSDLGCQTGCGRRGAQTQHRHGGGDPGSC